MSEGAGDAGGEGTCPCLHGRDIVPPPIDGTGTGAELVGRGSPKNSLLQTEPRIQEVLGIDHKGHDCSLRVTDARPDTGGLPGATPAEAVSRGKVDPERLPDAVARHTDVTIAPPLRTHYVCARHDRRPPGRLCGRREELVEKFGDACGGASGPPGEPEGDGGVLDRHR